ncbi:ABC transporter substrate-binding protein [Clostridium hydrogeniformans]|uniref:ABC transporter substrate-binding protein n=1 Tax=Clostridium hydrogeniformans TaxID=349933 RepID=UPI00048122D5|nr:extracellular solute-binding protein [Clostridium hydrogeniformans]
MRKINKALLFVLSSLYLVGCNSADTSKISNEKKVITLTTFSASEFLKVSEKMYEARHPDIDIQINEYLGEMNTLKDGAVEKYIQQTNTKMLADNGPDILQFDHLSVENYASKNLLANLTELMNEDKSFNKDNYHMNIINNSTLNGTLYDMPMRFSIRTLVGDEEAISETRININDKNWDWSKFIENGEALLDKNVHSTVIANMEPERMFNELVKDEYSKLVDSINKKANFQSDTFINLLNTLKSMYEKKVATNETSYIGDSYFINYLAISEEDFFLGPSAFYEHGKTYLKPQKSDEVGKISFATTMKLGINKKSSVKKEAWDFLRFLMSEDVQKLDFDIKGFTINKNVYEEKMKKIKEAPLTHPNGTIINVKNQDIERLNEIVNRANIHLTEDATMEKIMTEEFKAFFSGQKSAQEISRLIQNRISIYLNE